MIQRAIRDEPISIHGTGAQIRAWCYIDDMVEGIMRCLTMDAAIGESFNIGNERTVMTIFSLANMVIRVLGSHSSIHFEEKKSADIELRIPRIDKGKSLLGFEAKVDLEAGIKLTAEHYRKEDASSGKEALE
jgi:UDP-glucose 4-epimerase